MEPTDPTSAPFPDKSTRAKLYSRLDAQDKVLADIHGALVGKPELGVKGLVTRVAEAETNHTNLKDKVDGHDRKLWLAGILVTLAGPVLAWGLEHWLK